MDTWFQCKVKDAVGIKWLGSLILCALIFSGPSFRSVGEPVPSLNGAWMWKEGDKEQVVTIVDGYFILCSYDHKNKTFDHTWGGPCKDGVDELEITLEVDTREAASVGRKRKLSYTFNDGQLIITAEQGRQVYDRLDAGQAPLSGVWRISGRKQGDQMNEMPLGARRTLKILSGTRFQWVAINVSTGEFFGTGGGTYTFSDGLYTETIRFFSRDSSRVGAQLRFDGKLVDGNWHHSGLSSKGDPIYEVWTSMYKP